MRTFNPGICLNRCWISALFIFSILLFGSPGIAADPKVPDYQGGFITDFTKTIPSKQRVLISRTLRMASQSSRIHVMLVVINKMADYKQMPQKIGKFAAKLAQEWKIGNAKTKQGLLLLFSLRDRKFFISKTSNLPLSLTEKIRNGVVKRAIIHLKKKETAKAMAVIAKVVLESVPAKKPVSKP